MISPILRLSRTMNLLVCGGRSSGGGGSSAEVPRRRGNGGEEYSGEERCGEWWSEDGREMVRTRGGGSWEAESV